jgi:hypothetical protein
VLADRRMGELSCCRGRNQAAMICSLIASIFAIRERHTMIIIEMSQREEPPHKMMT